MQILSEQEIEQVGGARINAETAMQITLGLMVLSIASPVIIGVGAVSLITLAWL